MAFSAERYSTIFIGDIQATVFTAMAGDLDAAPIGRQARSGSGPSPPGRFDGRDAARQG